MPDYSLTHEEAEAIAQKRSPSSLAQYGLDRETYALLVFFVGKRCPMCDKAFTEGRVRPRVIDHDHVSGLVRGIICRQCNDKVGHLHENVAWMRNAADYLTYPPALTMGIVAMHWKARGK